MKHWRIITVGVLAAISLFVPLALFAAISQYDNPLGCSITSLPQFIKAVLTIIVKVGIPVATIFIIWSGFLFLTAQGDEAQLSKAKKSFVWACIGTAVLLGAWLLATAINATIQSLGGGTSGGGSTTVSGGCVSGGGTPPPSTTPPPLNAMSCLPSEGELPLENPYVSLNLEKNPFSGIFPQSSNCSAAAGMEGFVFNANDIPFENSYVFMTGANINGKKVTVALDVNEGSSQGVYSPKPEDIQQLLTKYNPTAIYLVHTHPLSTVGESALARPSGGDIDIAMNYTVSDSRVRQVVADPTGVWIYDASKSSQYNGQVLSVGLNDQKYFPKDGSVPPYRSGDQCERFTIFKKALAGDYGSEGKAWADKVMADSGEYMDSIELHMEAAFGKEIPTGNVLSLQERNAKTEQSVSLLKQMGVQMTYISDNQLASCPNI